MVYVLFGLLLWFYIFINLCLRFGLWSFFFYWFAKRSEELREKRNLQRVWTKGEGENKKDGTDERKKKGELRYKVEW